MAKQVQTFQERLGAFKKSGQYQNLSSRDKAYYERYKSFEELDTWHQTRITESEQKEQA